MTIRVKINQLIKERNKKLYESGALFLLLIGVALLIDKDEPSIIIITITFFIKVSSLYGLILLSRRIREPIKCPCCNADLSFAAYAKTNTKTCSFCKIRFDQDSASYKRKLIEIKEDQGIVDAEFFDDI